MNQPRAPRAPGARPDQNCGIDSPILALAARTRARARGRSRRFGRRSSMRPAIGAAFGSLSRHLTRNGGRCQSQQAELGSLFRVPPNAHVYEGGPAGVAPPAHLRARIFLSLTLSASQSSRSALRPMTRSSEVSCMLRPRAPVGRVRGSRFSHKARSVRRHRALGRLGRCQPRLLRISLGLQRGAVLAAAAAAAKRPTAVAAALSVAIVNCCTSTCRRTPSACCRSASPSISHGPKPRGRAS